MRELTIAWLFLTASCSAFDPKLATEPFLCGSGAPECPSGYSCQTDTTGQMVCVAHGHDAIIDGPYVDCHDDSALEPNDTIQTAFVTPVEQFAMEVPYAGLAICPNTDVDNYEIQMTAPGHTVDVAMIWEPGAPLTVELLGADGSTVAQGTPSATNPDESDIQFSATNAGKYYIKVWSQINDENNYTLSIKASP